MNGARRQFTTWKFNLLWSVSFCLFPSFILHIRADDSVPRSSDTSRITISKDTTWITEPVGADGYVQYGTALRRLNKAGVTDDNNFAVALVRTMGPHSIYLDRGSQSWKRLFAELGISPLPKEGAYYVPLPEIAKRNAPDGESQMILWHQRIYAFKQYPDFTARAFEQKELPVVSEWLSANKGITTRISDALSKCDKYYEPIVTTRVSTLQEMEGLAGITPLLRTRGGLFELLSSQCMHKLQKGDKRGAWNDITLRYRFSRLAPRYPTLLQCVNVLRADAGCSRSVIGFAHHAQLTSMEARQLIHQLSQLPPRPNCTTAFDVAERYRLLAYVTALAREGPSSAIRTFTGEHYGSLVRALEHVPIESFDWDGLMKSANRQIDACIAAHRFPKYSQRAAAYESIKRATQQMKTKVKKPGKIADATETGDSLRTTATAAVENWMGAYLYDWPATKHECSSRVYMAFAKLALALSAYHSEHDAYPDKLADLVPFYFKEIPRDEFADGKPLGYILRNGGYIVYSVGHDPAGTKIHERIDPRRFRTFDQGSEDVVMISPEVKLAALRGF